MEECFVLSSTSLLAVNADKQTARLVIPYVSNCYRQSASAARVDMLSINVWEIKH